MRPLEKIDELFQAAMAMAPEHRSAFLDMNCGDDLELRHEVESLLAAHGQAGDFIEESAGDVAAQLLAQKQSLESGRMIGQYRVEVLLGAGGMGEVYRAKDKLGRNVALKLLSQQLKNDKSGIARFKQEARSLLALNHPHIVTIYDIDQTDSVYYIASELVEGETLCHRLDNGVIALQDALEITIQIATALAAAHEKGIVHRDIKPENIMIRRDGYVKVLDFGIAKLTAGSSATDLEALTIKQVNTAEGTVVGTAPYMSPEQARGLPVDERTDIWSLGVVLYEMLAGCRPFLGETVMDVMFAVIERQPAPFSTHGLLVPESLEQLVFKALRKEREARYQTAAELQADLKGLKQKLERQGEQEQSDFQRPSAASAAGLVDGLVQPNTGSELPGRTIEEGRATTSSAEYVVGRIKHHKYALVGVVTLLIAVIGFLTYRSFFPNNIQQIESIAVLPFVNASGNSEVEYLSDGMTDMLITSLSQLPKLSVKARSSVFRYKGKDAPPQQVGKELNVQAILNGRVVQRGNDLTLHIELVDVKTETALWSADYNRSMTNLVALQGEIARDVSQKLRARLSGAEEQKVTRDYTANAEAYQLYLKGRFHVFKLTPPEIKIGISYLQQAIQIDPNYALAYVGLSEANRSLALGTEMTPTEFLPKARATAQKAIEIDDSLAEGHSALGASMFWHDWNWNEVENQYQRALELNPNSAETHKWFAHLLSNTGRHLEALAEISRAKELDPYSPFLNALEGQFLIHAGKPDEALARLRETFDLAPDFWFPHMFASSAYIEKGMFAEAIAEARRARELSGGQTISVAFEGYAQAKLGKRDETRVLLDGLLKLSKERFVPPCHIALLYNALDERDQALAWLERGFEQRDPKMTFLKVEPKWNNMRDDPRFADLMRRMGFSQ